VAAKSHLGGRWRLGLVPDLEVKRGSVRGRLETNEPMDNATALTDEEDTFTVIDILVHERLWVCGKICCCVRPK